MQVRLEPVGSTGRRARVGERLAVVAPVGLLVAVVLAASGPGALAPGATPAATVLAGAAGAGPAGQPTPSAAPGGSRTAAGESGPRGPRRPNYAFDLPVRTVTALLADRATGTIRGGLVAVHGLLGQDPAAAPCEGPDPGLTAVFCRRTALLTADVESMTDVRPGMGAETAAAAAQISSPRTRSGPRLQATIPAGIPMPSIFQLDSRSPDEAGPVMRSIIVGRFTSPRPRSCLLDRGTCRDDFILERLAWAEGGWIDRLLVRDPGVPLAAAESVRRPMTIATREADRMEQILSLAVLQPGRLDQVDQPARAAGAIGAASLGVAFEGPIWYVRSVGRPFVGRDRALTWAVIDDASGFVLAGGAVEPG